MAIKTAAAGGGAWASAGTWVEGSIPANGDDVVFYDMGNGKLSRPVIFHAEKPQTDVVQSSNPERTLVTTTHVPRGTAPTIVDGKVVPPSAPPAAAAPVAPKVLLSKNGRSYQRGPNGELTWLN